MDKSNFWVCEECGAEMYGFEKCQYCGAQKTKAGISWQRTCKNVSKWKAERFICSECGCIADYESYESEPYMFVDGAAAVPSYCPNCGARIQDD